MTEPAAAGFTIAGVLDLDTAAFGQGLKKVGDVSKSIVDGFGDVILKLALFNQVLELSSKFMALFAELEKFSAPIRYIFTMLERVTQGFLFNVAQLLEPLIVEIGKVLIDIIAIVTQLLPLLEPVVWIISKILGGLEFLLNALIEGINFVRESLGLKAVDPYSLASQGFLPVDWIMGAIQDIRAERLTTGKVESVVSRLDRGDPGVPSWITPTVKESKPSLPTPPSGDSNTPASKKEESTTKMVSKMLLGPVNSWLLSPLIDYIP